MINSKVYDLFYNLLHERIFFNFICGIVNLYYMAKIQDPIFNQKLEGNGLIGMNNVF